MKKAEYAPGNERKELDLLLEKGVSFEVQTGRKKRTFRFNEPTLGTLDRLSRLWVDMVIDEELLNDHDVYLSASKKLVMDNARRMARVIAIAVTPDSYSVSPVIRCFKSRMYEWRIKRLTRLFYHTVIPSRLFSLSYSIIAMGNLGDFINSMRLMSGARTTVPIKSRIEKQG
jgi:hypothetical protein